MRHPKVYELLVQRGAWNDPPDTDEIIAAALDAARDAVAACRGDKGWERVPEDAIDALRGES